MALQFKTLYVVSDPLMKAVHDGEETLLDAGRKFVDIADETIPALIPDGIAEKVPARKDAIDALFEAIDKMFEFTFEVAAQAITVFATEAPVPTVESRGNGHATVTTQALDWSQEFEFVD